MIARQLSSVRRDAARKKEKTPHTYADPSDQASALARQVALALARGGPAIRGHWRRCDRCCRQP
jgi:hypothetical protein